jgi:hypothetical protein
MAIICRETKLLFLLNPRTGSTALANHLINEWKGEWAVPQNIVDENGRLLVPQKHPDLEQVAEHGIVSKEELKNYLIFTGVANPYDSLLTLYKKMITTYPKLYEEGALFLRRIPQPKAMIDYAAKHSFNRWLVHFYWKAALKAFLGLEKFSMSGRYTDSAAVLLRKDHLQEDFAQMLKSRNIPGNYDIPRLNQTRDKGKDYMSAYNFFTKFLVGTLYKEDIYNYKNGFPGKSPSNAS